MMAGEVMKQAVRYWVIAVMLVGCDQASDNLPSGISITGSSSYEGKQAFFGDLHVHTMYSFDAFIFGTTASPDEAYRFAKGASLRHPGGFDMRLERPMDFYAVSDHAFYLGSIRAMALPNTPLSGHELAAGMADLDKGTRRRDQFNAILRFLTSDRRREILNEEISRDAWEDIQAAAERHYEPGKFTTFVAYEYTATTDDRGNLHRNVIFKDSRVPERPFSRIDSSNPEDLWAWMDRLRGRGIESIAIPHNSNGSNGNMFTLVDYSGDPLTASYANTRLRNEPVVEITQIKGTSDTHPALSPNDEWADFEIMPYRVATQLASQPSGSYVREALGNGLHLSRTRGFNPFQFGFIGSSDTHNASYSGEEYDYWSKISLVDDTPQERGSVPLNEPLEAGSLYSPDYYNLWSASGLAGVWADANTREAIFDAFRKKEVFATSGPRIKIKFSAQIAGRKVIMGGSAGAPAQSPAFAVSAMRDALGAPLQRLQIIKVWATDAGPQEAVFDVACSDGGQVDPTTHRCGDNGARVNIKNCTIPEHIGAAELQAEWQDPTYNADTETVYYARVLENPTCRWSTWDAVRAGVEPRPGMAATIQERAWTSPIWLQLR